MSSSDLMWQLSNEAREVEETENRLARERQRDRLIANLEAHNVLADMHMPEDLRSQARQWRMEEFMAAVWRAGWQSGFRLATVARAKGEGEGNG